MALAEDSFQIFDFEWLIWKIFRHKELAVYFLGQLFVWFGFSAGIGLGDASVGAAGGR